MDNSKDKNENSEVLTTEAADFKTVLAEALEPSEEYDVSKWLYVPAIYKNYRYILGTRGKNPLICIGINPSTAKPDDLDNTLKSVQRIAKGNGYDSFIMFNVYAHRATDPNNMERELNLYLHQQNMKAFEYILSLYKDESPSLWAAWGTIIEKRSYLKTCLNDMIRIGIKYDSDWYNCGKITKAGHPHHPLYLRKDLMLDKFDIEDYYSTLRNNL